MKHLFIAMRPYQWLKNLFIFTPLVFGQQLFNPLALLRTVLMFMLFSLVSGAVYLINDAVDLRDDRQHPLKRLRPLASGRITAGQTRIAAIMIGSIATALSFILDKYCGWIVLIYIILNYLYMKALKRMVIIDVFCIGAFFFLRIICGAATSRVELSHWIILCTVLLALFLAFNKRLYDLKISKSRPLVLAKYNRYFIDRMIAIISSSTLMAYTLYVMDAKTVERFATGHLIYTVPFVYYGLFRYLYLIDKKGFGGDPARLLLKDGIMQLNLILWGLACIGIIYFKL